MSIVIVMQCGVCDRCFDQVLTFDLTAPVCPSCGHVGDREVSLDFPMGVLAGRVTLREAKDEAH